MPRPPIETGNPWIALLVALGALGAAVWLFAGADEAALERPTVAERLVVLADDHPRDTDLLVVPVEVPGGWGEPGIETSTAGDRLERFELRLVRRFEDPDTEGAFVAVRLYVCTAADPAPCGADRSEVTRTTTSGLTTVVAVDEPAFLDAVSPAWSGIDLTSDWSALDWPTRQR